MPMTKLSPEEEKQFRSWYQEKAEERDLNRNPDDPQHFYDYRGAYKAGEGPDKAGHWPSRFKQEGHPRLFLGGQDTRSPHWQEPKK